ncbi:MAG: hypothetical protein MI919_06930, partial [Holophagales bacterium]|nr:hypothetical protein [Holophagales bacterium]
MSTPGARILVSCPPMLGILDQLGPELERHGFEAVTPEVVQTLSVAELEALLPTVDGWIIGDDPACRQALEAGRRGRLRAMVKWGVGVDNVDFAAARDLGLPVTHTPGMFGDEVADIAVGYVIALARDTFRIDRGVRAGGWPKPRGISLAGKTVALVGFGDIGQAIARRLVAAKMDVLAYDPRLDPEGMPAQIASRVVAVAWPDRLEEAHVMVLCCALTPENHHLIDAATLGRLRPGVRLVNVARGPLVDEAALE